MTTALQLITTGLRKISVYSTGETLGSDVSADGLAVLNSMLDGWSIERLMCPNLLQESFSLTNSVGSYTIGSGGDFNTTRPTKIVDPCFIRDSSNLDSPVQIIDAAAYGRIVQKNIDGSYPGYLFYDAAYASALATIYLYPEPQSGLTLYINSWKQLASLSTLTASLSLPPGYQRAIEWNFALEFCSEFGKEPPASVVAMAKQTKAAIKSLNITDAFMRMDSGIVQTYGSNILTGP